ncbi:Archaetidylserine synthase [uncultured archaeon]|nr:Archaetidylserine synthase [uncultured archaeon]
MNILRMIRPPDLLTLLNIAFGFSALLAAARYSQIPPQAAVVFILLAAMADGLDGFLARRLGSGPLGASLDSLADLVSFGAAPAFLALQTFDPSPQAWLLGIIYLVCGTLRLARFDTSQKSDQFFEGLPIPAAGIALSASVLLDRSGLTLLIMLALSLAMVSSISFPKIRDMMAFSLLGLVLLGAGSLIWLGIETVYAALLLLIIIMIYLASPVVISCPRKGR